MKQLEAEELCSCLPGGRTLFTYGKDWYAVSLLQMGLRQTSLQQIKQGPMAKLLEKPRLRAWLGSLGKKSPTADDLALLWPEEVETYRLTVGLFDGWLQTSRKDHAWNIVLQLNLNEEDARMMDRKFPERWQDPFERTYHPIHEGKHRTLAWARIDLDWRTGEALIEEIQNDRIREVGYHADRIKREKLEKIKSAGIEVDAAFVLRYWEERLRLSRQWWDEAMMCAAVRFIVGELGIRTIYYHSPVSGARLKGDGAENAPVSLYSELPRRFCFERTTDIPSFLKPPRRKHRAGLWMHRLCL
ncbi:MAG: hypothetical protein EOP88_24350 [Verrucomicrobiaceae bacterium]|nr:MAG: hypothetical protein EOP88_24350 [Verrucomicrobiaceae bacterium]